ncbi:MAG: DeoR family transcriptional regulator, partial [Candidatus Absconditabacteria bacterium]
GNDYYSVEEEIDSSRFIEYFLGGIENELGNLQSTIEKISNDEDFENNLIVARLNNRQIHIATYIIKNLSVSSKELLNEYNITKATLKRDLKTLIDNEIIKSVGKGKATKYESAKKNKNTANSIEKETNI